MQRADYLMHQEGEQAEAALHESTIKKETLSLEVRKREGKCVWKGYFEEMWEGRRDSWAARGRGAGSQEGRDGWRCSQGMQRSRPR